MNFTGMIKLRILLWEIILDYSGVLNLIIRIPKSFSWLSSEWKGNVITEEHLKREANLLALKMNKGVQEPTNGDSLRSWKG